MLHEADLPGLDVDLDDRDVGAERVGGSVCVTSSAAASGPASPSPSPPLPRRFADRQLGPRQRLGRHAGHAEAAVVGQHDVGLVRFEPRGCDRRRARQHLCGRGVDRRAPELERARATGAATARDESGVGLDVADVRQGEPEAVGDDHGERRGVPLAVGRGARAHGRRAVLVHLDRAVLVRRPAGSDLHVGAHADAELPAVAGRPASFPFGAQIA